MAWRLEVPGEGISLTVRAAMNDQELVLTPIAYWEGVIEVSGTSKGTPVKGKGYLEMTGYAGDITGLR